MFLYKKFISQKERKFCTLISNQKSGIIITIVVVIIVTTGDNCSSAWDRDATDALLLIRIIINKNTARIAKGDIYWIAWMILYRFI